MKIFKATKNSLSARILWILFLFIIPLDLLAMITSMIILSDARNSIILSTRTILANYMKDIDTVIRNTEVELSAVISFPNEYESYFSGTDTNALDYQLSKSALTQELLRHQSYSHTTDYFFFLRTDQDFLLIPHNDRTLDSFFTRSDFLHDTEKHGNGWQLVEINSDHYLIHSYFYRSVCYGALIHLDPVITDLDRNLEFSPQSIQFHQSSESFNSSRWITASCQNAELSLSVSFDRFLLNHSVSVFRWVLVILIVFFIFLMPLMYHFLKVWLLRPLQTLETAHRKLREGEENYRISENANSAEFQTVFESFNQMADSLQTLRLENINKELAKNKMLLDNLQLQIRPHFLLNAFSLLFALVQQRNSKPAQKLILYLSNYFRYLFRYNRNLELFSREYELIEQYLEVAKIQTHDAFVFQSDFEPEIYFVRIPPLLLHNFIENIISHALIPGKIIHIMMDGSYENGYVTFHIADDGRGMPLEDVEQINRMDYPDFENGRHVGIRNSITRLKYFYDGKGSVTVTSSPGEGSIFTITFPYNLDDNEEDDSYETTDGK